MWLNINYGRVRMDHVVSLQAGGSGPYEIHATTVTGAVLGLPGTYPTMADAQAAIDGHILKDIL